MTFRAPGRVKGSYGYSCNGNKGSDGRRASYGPRFGKGDVVGCGVFYDACFFTKNGVFIGVAFRGVKRTRPLLYPTVWLSGSSVEGNFGQSAFTYNLHWERVRSNVICS